MHKKYVEAKFSQFEWKCSHSRGCVLCVIIIIAAILYYSLFWHRYLRDEWGGCICILYMYIKVVIKLNILHCRRQYIIVYVYADKSHSFDWMSRYILMTLLCGFYTYYTYYVCFSTLVILYVEDIAYVVRHKFSLSLMF